MKKVIVLDLTRARISRHVLPMAILVAGIVIAGIIVLFKQSSPQADNNTAVSTATLEACAGTEDFSCYEDYFEARTTATNPVTATDDLRNIYETDQYAKSQCHQMMHAIGHAAYAKYKTVASAYTKGDTFCWSGYYHGVTEEAIGQLGAEKVKEMANAICEELKADKPYSFDHYNCAHGLGHGFYTVANANLFEGLKVCDLLHDGWERESCYGGAFMENVMVEVRNGGTSAYLRPNEPMYPCTAVEYIYKQQCYLMQTSYALQHNGYNFAETFRICRDVADVDFTLTCYESIGRDASGSTVSNATQTKQHCEQAPDAVGLERCVLGAVRDFVSYFHGDTEGKAFCNSFDSALKTRCLEEVDNYYRTF